MIKLNENSEDVVSLIEYSLNSFNIAVDMTVSKASMLFDLLMAIVFLFMGAFCKKNCNGFLKPVFWLFEKVSFFAAAALVVPVIFRIFTGHEPTNNQMLITVVVILLFPIIVHVSPALLSILYNFCKVRVTVVDVLTLAPFLWLRRFSYKWLFTCIFLSLLLMATVWLVGSVLNSGNVITASLITCLVLLLAVLAMKGSLVHALLIYVLL